jgi:hypothetical protein
MLISVCLRQRHLSEDIQWGANNCGSPENVHPSERNWWVLEGWVTTFLTLGPRQSIQSLCFTWVLFLPKTIEGMPRSIGCQYLEPAAIHLEILPLRTPLMRSSGATNWHLQGACSSLRLWVVYWRLQPTCQLYAHFLLWLWTIIVFSGLGLELVSLGASEVTSGWHKEAALNIRPTCKMNSSHLVYIHESPFLTLWLKQKAGLNSDRCLGALKALLPPWWHHSKWISLRPDLS